MKSREEQDIYKAILGTAEETSEGLKKVADNIKKVLETLLESHYTKNKALAKLAAANPLNPILTQNLDDAATKRMAESLHKIHNELSETSKEIVKIQETVKIMQGRGDIDPRMRTAYEKQLRGLNELNSKYKEIYKQLNEHAVILGEGKLATPEQRKTLEDKLDPIYKQARELKVSAQQKQRAVQNVEESTRPRSNRLG